MNPRSDGGGYRGDNAAVGEQPPLMLHWLEQAGKGAARADGYVKGTAAKDMRGACVQIGSHDGCTNGQVLDSIGAEPFLHKLANKVLRSRRVASAARTRLLCIAVRVVEADEISDANAAAEFAKLARGDAVGEGRAEQGPDTGAHNRGHGDAFLLENVENAQMGESSGEAATQSHGDPGSFSMGPDSAQADRGAVWTLQVRFGPTERCHAASLAGQYGFDNHTEELDFRYAGTWYQGQGEIAVKGGRNVCCKGNSTSRLCD